MKLSYLWGQAHKWIGIVIGIQVVLWIAGGVVMTWFPIEEVRSEHNIREIEPVVISPGEIGVPLETAIAGRDVVSAQITRVLGRLVYVVRTETDDAELIDAANGEALSPIPAGMALAIAVADFAGEGTPGAAELLEATNTEYRGAVPVWRIDMNDVDNSHLYVSPDTGRVVARRSDVWRLFDFFWMLHIMDYEDRTDFNHPLVIWASIIGLILSISGIVLVFYRFTKRDVAWFRSSGGD